MNWTDRAKKRMNELGLTQNDLIHTFNVKTRGAVGHYLSNRREPNQDQLVSLAKKLECSLEWLLTGNPKFSPERVIEGHVIRPERPRPAQLHPHLKPVQIIEWENPEDLPDDQYALIPRVRLKLSAGNGTLITEELPDAPLAFTTEWIKRKGVKRSKLVIVNATGDSMEPTLCDGALLLIDTGSTEITDGRIYALRYGDQLRVKRLYRRYDGGLIIRSDNQHKYPDEILTPTDMNEHIYVIGRVIWQAGDL